VKLVSFDAFRSIGMPNVHYIKPEMALQSKPALEEADWVLFPEYWQVNFLTYGLKRNIFPNSASFHLGHDKVEMTRAMWSVFPEHVPYTLILANTETNREKVLEEMSFPFVAKEVRNSMGRGVYLIESRQQWRAYCEQQEVLYVQEKLDIDRDLRIVYVGDDILCSYWRVAEEGNFKNNVAQGGRIETGEIPASALDFVRNAAEKLGVNHAGFDVAMVGDHPYFLEFNTMFGNQALYEMNVPIQERILEYLQKQMTPHTPRPVVPSGGRAGRRRRVS
jgi:ribosomal protein S6--L-glutamate ligase